MSYKITKHFSITAVALTAVMLFFTQSCGSKDDKLAPSVSNRDSMPVLKSIGVSTLISDSGIISYKIISEDWFIYDRTEPTYWSFEKGMFIEKFNKNHIVEAYISCDTAYYYDQKKLWELRGRVLVKNQKGETFKTTLLFWDQNTHEIYSDRFMKIEGETELQGYNFRSNEQMTDYKIYSSQGAFPFDEKDAKQENDTTEVKKQQQK